MRPVLLEMTGFGSFRDPATVDFRDADYFALVGPTGSGKSTVIDAITFALYGTVPRWNDRSTVGLALAPTVNRGTVRLVFDVAGQRYVAARELRRAASGGVNTKAARLERLHDPAGLGAADEDTEVLAADSGVSAAVEKLLGLPYEHFITCVVLPQGDFAEFLHKAPAKRQEILVKLLGLEIYGQIAQLANQQAATAKEQAEYAEKQLASYTDATDEAERAARQEATGLRHLVDEVRDAVPGIIEASSRAAQAKESRDQLAEERDLLAAVQIPAGIDDLGAEVRSASIELAEATKLVGTAEASDNTARARREKAPARAPLERAQQQRIDLAGLETKLTYANKAHQAAAAALKRSEKAVNEAATAAKNAAAHREAIQRDDLAAALRPHLKKGSPCPVCDQMVRALPTAIAAPRLSQAEELVIAADTKLETARRANQTAARAETKAKAELESLTEQIARLQTALADAPTQAAVTTQLAELDRIDEACVRADQHLRQARQRKEAADSSSAKLKDRLDKAWSTLDTTRDPLVQLGAPQLSRDDLVRAWSALVGWAGSAAAAREKKLAGAQDKLTKAARAANELVDKLRASLAAQGVYPEPDRPLADTAEGAVVAAHERASAKAERIKERRAEAANLEESRAESFETQQVARQLGLLLKADAFPRWLVATALDLLVEDASATLSELSGGQFELTHKGGEFQVIDHADADSRRPVKTLSGGETFQASLSLALALSAQLAAMAAAGAAKLDSIFLDEGFGTLDETTLEIVAATLENLATRGDRMVGIVTHVLALAERIPTRFAIQRDPRTSSVVREML